MNQIIKTYAEVNIINSQAGVPLCLVAAVLAYLKFMKRTEGLLFRFRNGDALTHEWFNQSERGATVDGIDQSKHSEHT